MAFSLDELKKKAKSTFDSASDKAKDTAELAKITLAIASEQKELEKNYRAIGEWFVNEFGGEIPEDAKSLLEAVAASKNKIAELEASKPVAKEAHAEEVIEAEGEEVPAEEEETGKVCPVCGQKSDSKFCPHCGAPMGD